MNRALMVSAAAALIGAIGVPAASYASATTGTAKDGLATPKACVVIHGLGEQFNTILSDAEDSCGTRAVPNVLYRNGVKVASRFSIASVISYPCTPGTTLVAWSNNYGDKWESYCG